MDGNKKFGVKRSSSDTILENGLPARRRNEFE
jgi:hypothetical protein